MLLQRFCYSSLFCCAARLPLQVYRILGPTPPMTRTQINRRPIDYLDGLVFLHFPQTFLTFRKLNQPIFAGGVAGVPCSSSRKFVADVSTVPTFPFSPSMPFFSLRIANLNALDMKGWEHDVLMMLHSKQKHLCV